MIFSPAVPLLITIVFGGLQQQQQSTSKRNHSVMESALIELENNWDETQQDNDGGHARETPRETDLNQQLADKDALSNPKISYKISFPRSPRLSFPRSNMTNNKQAMPSSPRSNIITNLKRYKPFITMNQSSRKTRSPGSIGSKGNAGVPNNNRNILPQGSASDTTVDAHQSQLNSNNKKIRDEERQRELAVSQQQRLDAEQLRQAEQKHASDKFRWELMQHDLRRADAVAAARHQQQQQQQPKQRPPRPSPPQQQQQQQIHSKRDKRSPGGLLSKKTTTPSSAIFKTTTRPFNIFNHQRPSDASISSAWSSTSSFAPTTALTQTKRTTRNRTQRQQQQHQPKPIDMWHSSTLRPLPHSAASFPAGADSSSNSGGSSKQNRG